MSKTDDIFAMTQSHDNFPSSRPDETDEPRLIITDRYGREVTTEHVHEAEDADGGALDAARSAYVDALNDPVIDGATMKLVRKVRGASAETGDDAARRSEYLDVVTDAVRLRLEAERTEDHTTTNTRIAELVGDEWEALGGELYERRVRVDASRHRLRQYGGRALFAAEAGAAAVVTHYTHFGYLEPLLPATAMGTTAALTRFRPDQEAIDEVHPPTENRGPVEEQAVKLLNELGLKENTTRDTLALAMKRWLKRHKPSLQSEGGKVYTAVKARFEALPTDSSEVDAYRLRSAVELTFASLEEAQHAALTEERNNESHRRWIAGGAAYFAMLGLMYFGGIATKDETPPEKSPTFVEPSPTNSGPNDGVTEEPLPSDVPSEGYFDDK
ncbi:hypothetical protein RAAC3_TM7C00001G0513 [Candidatus Saccharibacteria bacterium RAAC3_TM7_1]|nr:hypothetical protein RAAC3_TM7C00001G0513 [Candidatus Saccharibacteria bacterium RAAC3_TM7_1]HCZ28641.1 hypothetical protein [Candidatus Saccharibacteria bacterium]